LGVYVSTGPDDVQGADDRDQDHYDGRTDDFAVVAAVVGGIVVDDVHVAGRLASKVCPLRFAGVCASSFPSLSRKWLEMNGCSPVMVVSPSPNVTFFSLMT